MQEQNIQKVLTWINENPSRLIQRSTWSIAQRVGVTKEDVVEAKRRFHTVVDEKTIEKDFETNEIKGKLVLETEPKGEDDLFTFFNIDKTKWQISRIWSIWKNQKYHTSVYFKPRDKKEDFNSSFSEFVDEYLSTRLCTTAFEVPDYKHEAADLALVLCLFDLHLGRIVHENYTGRSLSPEETISFYKKTLSSLIADVPKDRVEQIILPIGNDFFNVDDSRMSTTRGTVQQNFYDLHKIFKDGLSLLTEAILELVKIAPVQVVLVPGNHDNLSSTYLAVSIEKIFENHSHVYVDSRPIDRKYLSYGKVGLAFSHGEMKMENYARLFPHEAKEIFAETTHHEVLLGHFHHERSKKTIFDSLYTLETDGVTVRHLASLTKCDLWTFKEGYTLSKRRAYAILYHKDRGRYMEFTHIEPQN